MEQAEVDAEKGNIRYVNTAQISKVRGATDVGNELPNSVQENSIVKDLQQIPIRGGPRHKRIIGMELQVPTAIDENEGVHQADACNGIQDETYVHQRAMKNATMNSKDKHIDEDENERRHKTLFDPPKQQQQIVQEKDKVDGGGYDATNLAKSVAPRQEDSFNHADTPAFMKLGSTVSDSSEINPSRVIFSIAKELKEFCNIASLEQESLTNLKPALSTFISYGAEDEESLAANRNGFSRYALRSRVLTDVSNTDYSTTILNGKIRLAFPVCVGPFTGAMAVHPDGEIAVAQAAHDAEIVYTVPHYSGYPIDDIRTGMKDSKYPFFFQFYPYKPTNQSGEGAGLQREYIREALPHLSELKCSAVILTCDTVNNSNREKTYKNDKWIAEIGSFPNKPSLRNISSLASPESQGHSSAFTWKDIRWIKEECSKYGIALILKGIMTAEDTVLAVKAGVDAILVSNHGGRQLDGTLGSIEVVEECVQAAKGKLEVYMDGGVRRGKDIVKALALGAKCIFIGRPALWGLSVGGKQGVDRALAIFEEEYATVMQLCGCAKTSELSRDHVEDREGTPRQRPVGWIVAASAFCAGAAIVACRSRR